MKFTSWLLSGFISLTAVSTAAATDKVITNAKIADLNISIYNNNLALVKENRRVDLKQGVNNLAFEGVASRIKPETVLLDADNVTLLEQNYNYDVLSANSIIDQSVGKTVKTVIQNPTTGENIYDKAQIVSAAYGQPILKFSYGLETHFPGRLVFDELPQNLSGKPTLEAKVETPKAETKNISLAYLTNGINWKTNYVARVLSDDRLNLIAWVTINNESGVDYDNAKIQLIAGDINQVAPVYSRRHMVGMTKSMAPQNSYDAVQNVAAENISGYHIYNLPLKTDLKDKQTKQVTLFEKNDVAYKKEAFLDSPLYFNRDGNSEFKQAHPEMIYSFKNEDKENLGLPLPAGIIRFYENDNRKEMQFIGENSISHVAKGEEVRLKLGYHFDLFADGKINKVTKVSETMTKDENRMCDVAVKTYAYEAEVTFHNAEDKEKEIVFEQNLQDEMTIEYSNIIGRHKNAGTYVWKVNVPAQGEQKLYFKAVVPYKDRHCVR